MTETFSDTSFNIPFAVLKIDAWNQLDAKTQIYVFDSGHCMGSVGFYAPSAGLLCVSEGRPSRKQLKRIQEEMERVPPSKKPITIMTDDFFETRFPKVGKEMIFPSIKHSTKLLLKLLHQLFVVEKKQTVWIKIPHIGGFDLLPTANSGIHYKWIGSDSTHASRLCRHAFDLIAPSLMSEDNNGNSRKKRTILLSRVFDRDIPSEQVPTNINATILISMCWFLVLPERESLMWDVAYDAVRECYRVFLSQHSSPRETQAMLQFFQD